MTCSVSKRKTHQLHSSSVCTHLLQRRWITDPEWSALNLRRSLCTSWLTTSVCCERGNLYASVWKVLQLTSLSAELVLSAKPGVMSQCYLGVLVMVLVAGGAGQTDDRREAQSSCYGGFDLYFVLDKWVLLLLLNQASEYSAHDSAETDAGSNSQRDPGSTDGLLAWKNIRENVSVSFHSSEQMIPKHVSDAWMATNHSSNN